MTDLHKRSLLQLAAATALVPFALAYGVIAPLAVERGTSL